jgi:hypothetical protein
MYKYIFSGEIIPSRVNFTLSGVPEAPLFFPSLDVKVLVSFTIEASKVKVVLKSDTNFIKHTKSDAIATLKNCVVEYIFSFINIYCYISSYNYNLDISGLKCEELKLDMVFGVFLENGKEPTLDVLKSRGDEMSRILNLISSKPGLEFLKNVFADFRMGVEYPHMSGFHFYRALDTIRMNAYLGNWEKMNNDLGLSKEYYDRLNFYRKRNAHGEYPDISGEERILLSNDTKHVIDIFLDKKSSN